VTFVGELEKLEDVFKIILFDGGACNDTLLDVGTKIVPVNKMVEIENEGTDG